MTLETVGTMLVLIAAMLLINFAAIALSHRQLRQQIKQLSKPQDQTTDSLTQSPLQPPR